ncbi:hypothetical protein BMETH_1444_1 [methanotrophic bacterial endosymbiont of Bathymodiolus sp.]|nr:hypothetical protein BMETH_1444_1 [methanotrophic bacterial endosymbiont of Bathymodiolus sp.]
MPLNPSGSLTIIIEKHYCLLSRKLQNILATATKWIFASLKQLNCSLVVHSGRPQK